MSLAARASFASHRLIGWIYWDPGAIARYGGLGIPNGAGYYIGSRAAPLAPAGNSAVAAAFYSINPVFVGFALDLARQHTTFDAIFEARNEAVGEGLRAYVPEICDELASMGPDLWAVADALDVSGRVLHGAHRDAPRPTDSLVSAWLAVNCIREWRADTHWMVLGANNLSGVEAGYLHDAYLGYPGEWVPRSRGADDAALATARARLEARGFVTDGRVNDAGVAFREALEATTNELANQPWQLLGDTKTTAFIELIEPVGPRLMTRIDETAGPEWMPAARERRPRQG